MKSPLFSSPEALEARIAPATVFLRSPSSPTAYVRIDTTMGTAAELHAAIQQASFSGTDLEIGRLDLHHNPHFNGSDLLVTAAGGATVTVDDLDAAGIDLGVVFVNGPVGQIEAGDGSAFVPAIAKLQLASLGQTSGPETVSSVPGTIGRLHLTGDLQGTLRTGHIGTATIDGSLLGGSTPNSGSLFAGSIGTLTVGGSLSGGSGSLSGTVMASGSVSHATLGGVGGGTGIFSGNLIVGGVLPDLVVKGSIMGSHDPAAAVSNGEILVKGSLGRATVAGQITGGSAGYSGSVVVVGSLGSVAIHGGLFGGGGALSGTVTAGGAIGSVTLGPLHGDDIDELIGGAGPQSGAIVSSGRIGSVLVNGNLRGGSGEQSGSIDAMTTLGTVVVHGALSGGNGIQSGSVAAGKALGQVTVNGSLVGGAGGASGQIVSAGTLGLVAIGLPSQTGGELLGGSGRESGTIVASGNIGSIVITAGVIGGSGDRSGAVLGGNGIGALSIGGNLAGGAGTESGAIDFAHRLGSLRIGGSVEPVLLSQGQAAPAADSAAVLAGSIGSIQVQGDVIGLGNGSGSLVARTGGLGSVAIGGLLEVGAGSFGPLHVSAQTTLGSLTAGGIVGSPSHRVYLTAGGPSSPGAASLVPTIGAVRTVTELSFTDILAGYLPGSLEAVQAAPEAHLGHVRIGTVEAGTSTAVANPWISNTVLAGAEDTGTFGFGDILGGNRTIPSVIHAVIVHGGIALDGLEDGTVRFQIAADRIDSISLNGTPFPLRPGARNDLTVLPADGGNGLFSDTAAHEVGAALH